MKSILTFLIAGVGAHICIFDPPQRGMAPGTMARHPGSRECYVREGPCGPSPAGAPAKTFLAGTEFEIVFQQNLNHWNVEKPGWVDVGIAPLADADSNDHFRVFASFTDRPAHDMLSVANYTVTVAAPTVPGKYVIRTRYVSNNALEIDPPTNKQAIFYQCSDIEVTAPKVDSTGTPPVPECDLPKSGMYRVVAMGSNGLPIRFTDGYFYYNTDAQVKAWLHPDTNYTTFTDFSKAHPPEYVMKPGDSVQCSTWGGDAWYDVAVGPKSGLVPLASRNGATFWGIPGSTYHSDWDVVWGTDGVGTDCRLSWYKAPNGVGYWFDEMKSGLPPRMPTNCTSASEMVGCGGQH